MHTTRFDAIAARTAPPPNARSTHRTPDSTPVTGRDRLALDRSHRCPRRGRHTIYCHSRDRRCRPELTAVFLTLSPAGAR